MLRSRLQCPSSGSSSFPGFVSKLWLSHDEREVYRRIYQWSGAARAEAYAEALSLILRPVCVRGSVSYQVIPGEVREEFVAGRVELARKHSIRLGAQSWAVA